MSLLQIIARSLLVGAWTTFVVYWFANWSKVKATVEKQGRASRLMVIVPVAIGFLLLGSPLVQRVLPNTDFVYLLSGVLSVMGVVIAIWARRTLAGNWSSTVTFKEGHELIQRGPYRIVRHPIYTGLLMMMLAWAFLRSDVPGFLGVVCATLGFWYKLRKEEKLMSRHFPAYAGYKTRVKALVPWIWTSLLRL